MPHRDIIGSLFDVKTRRWFGIQLARNKERVHLHVVRVNSIIHEIHIMHGMYVSQLVTGVNILCISEILGCEK